MASAQHAVADLVTSGYPRSCISVLVRGAEDVRHEQNMIDRGALARATDCAALTTVPGVSRGTAIPSCTELGATEAVADALAGAGLPPMAARFFADAICHGAILVAVHCRARYISDAQDILDAHSDDGKKALPDGR